MTETPETPAAVAQRLARNASALLDNNNPTRALPLALEALRHDPTCVEALIALCRSYLDTGQPIKARETINDALRLQPDNAWALRVRAHVYVALSDYGSALAAIRASIERAPNVAASFALLAEIQARRGLINASRKAAKAALELDPNRAETYGSIGRSEMRSGSRRAARAAFREELRLAPNSWAAHNNLGVMSQRRGNDFGALKHFARSVRIFPRQVPIENLELVAFRAQVTLGSLAMLALAIVSSLSVLAHVARWAVLLVILCATVVGVLIRGWLPSEVRTAMVRTRERAVAHSTWAGLLIAEKVPHRAMTASRLERVGAIVSLAFGVVTIAVAFLPARLVRGWMPTFAIVVGTPAAFMLLALGTLAFQPDAKATGR